MKTPKDTARLPREKLFTMSFTLLIVSSFCCFWGTQGLNASISLYMDIVGYDVTYSGLAGAAFALTAALARLFIGPVIDSRGRYSIFIVGLIIFFAGTIAISFKAGLGFFFVCRFLQGVGFAIASTATATMAADMLPSSRLGEGIGYYGMGQAAAMALGPATAFALIQGTTPEYLFYGVAILLFLCGLISIGCRYEKRPEILPETSGYRKKLAETEERISASEQKLTLLSILKNSVEPKALSGAIPALFCALVFGFSIYFVGLYATSLSIGLTGAYFTASAVSMVSIRALSGRFMDKADARIVLVFALLCGFLTLILLMALPKTEGTLTTVLYIIAGLLYGLFIGIATPTNQAVSVKNSPENRWGAANALVLLTNDVGIGGGAAIWGLTIAKVNFSGTIIICMVCLVLAGMSAFIMYPKRKK